MFCSDQMQKLVENKWKNTSLYIPKCVFLRLIFHILHFKDY